MRWHVRSVLLSASLLSQAASASKPNIILFLCDDLGYGDVGCYGQKIIPTPNIDRLAKHGLRFTDGYAASPVCSPSRTSLMLGLHTGHTPIRMNVDANLSPGDQTVAEVLHSAGYRTAIFGKWGIGTQGGTGMPNKKGFDTFLGYASTYAAHNSYPDRLNRNDSWIAIPGNHLIKPNLSDKKGTYSNDLFVKEAKRFIAGKSSKPFFLYLPVTLPHPNNEEPPGKRLEIPSDAPFHERNWLQTNKNYGAMVARIDRYVGELEVALRACGHLDDTLVIFTSDNGPHAIDGNHTAFFKSNGPLRGAKRDLYEGGIRVPFIFSWPNHIRAGKSSSLPITFYDILPTLAEVGGGKYKKTDGVSIVDELLRPARSRAQKVHDYLYWEFYEGGRWQQAVRIGKFKVVRPNTTSAIEVYDLSKDLGERHDLAKQRPDLLQQGAGLFRTARTKPAKAVSPY